MSDQNEYGFGQMMTLSQYNMQITLSRVHSRKPAGVLCHLGCGAQMVLLEDPQAQCDVKVECPKCGAMGVKLGNRS
jgi:hypothetical protein